MSTQTIEDLNPQQIEAVRTIDGPLLIVAGAGSGKTRVITYRIANMLEHGIPQKSILALTFTNKAAREMQQRAREMTGKKLQGLMVSTFHAFGVTVIRNYVHALGYRENFSIYDTADQHQLLRDTAREIRFPLEDASPKMLLGLFSQIKTGRRQWDEEISEYKPLYDEYQSHLKLHNAVDFDDLIMLPIRLFEDRPDILGEYQERYRYIQVDEFQDTSHQQYRLLHLLGRAHGNVCVVGDDDQSIYSWRGADFSNLVRFEEDFPARREIKLERNYRSTDTILNAANGVISQNKNRKSKELWTETTGGKPIELYYPEDERAEAQWIAEMIQSLVMREKKRYEDIGILIRTNSLSRSIEEALLANNVPYTVSGGQSFFQRQEVKDITAYLRLMANPDDEVSLLRVLNTPRRGIGKRTLEVLSGLAGGRDISMYSAIQAAVHAADSPLGQKAQSDLESFLELIHGYADRFKSERKLGQVLREFIDEIDYWGYLVTEFHHNPRLAKFKYRNVELFTQILEEFEQDPDNVNPSIFDFLRRISLQIRDDQEDGEDQSRVQLMTIHAAKGLEHDIVFLAGVEEGLIPHARALEENPDNVEEERRLFYVAITRARQKLYLSACRQRRFMKELKQSSPSPFLEEIPQHLIEYKEPEGVVEEDEAADYFAQLKAKFSSSA